jgi:S-adenosylmethionine/arginine decarboxylase-like enzyme
MLKHQHLIVRSEIKTPPTEFDLDKMNLWFKDLIQSIGMKILSGPHTVYCKMVGNRGYTGVCVIETSHIALHTWDEESPAVIQLDVYTCSNLDVSVVIDKLKVFDPVKIDYTFIDRDGELRILEQKKFSL